MLSAIGVGVAVLLGKCMQGPCSVVPDIRSINSTETFVTVSYCSQISMHLSTSCSEAHVNHCAGVAPARPQCPTFF